MSSVDATSEQQTPAGSGTVRDLSGKQPERLRDSALALTERLAQLGSVTELNTKQLMRALVNMQLDVQAIWDLAILGGPDTNDALAEDSFEPSVSRELMAGLPTAVIQTDLDGCVTWGNSAAAELFDISESGLAGVHICDLVHEDDRMIMKQAVIEFAVDGSLTEEDLTERDPIRVRVAAVGEEALATEVSAAVQADNNGGSPAVTWIFEAPDEPLTDGLTLAQTFSQISTLPMQTSSRQDLMSLTAQFCERAFETEVGVSLTIGAPEDPVSLGSSSLFAQQIDAIQISADEGPCQEAWETRETVYSNDATTDSRWPRFAQDARDTELRSALATPIFANSEMLGVLNIYAVEVETFGPTNLRIVAMLARAAGAAIHRQEEEQQLRELIDQLELAMSSREVIEQAKGILMAQYRCSSQEAFTKMTRVSQDRNIRVRKVAEKIVASVERSARQQSGGS